MAAPPEGGRRILIVVGPGRSGTSTVAGALAMTGLEVPGESIKGNTTNPSGFYEPRWVVDFHKEFLAATDVADLDTSPKALQRIGAATSSSEVHDRLRSWLAERLETQPRLVIKDPRAVWFHALWASTCQDLGVEPGYVTMLRHPAEVAGSRQLHYQKAQVEDDRRKQVARIAGWINAALTAEQVTEGTPRNFVRYTDLVADWRSIITRIAETQHLDLQPGVDVSPHPVDAFIDPELHRVKSDWDAVGVPSWLSELGERTWTALTALADDGDTDANRAAVAEVRRAQAELIDTAEAMTSHERRRRERDAMKRARRQARGGADDAAPDRRAAKKAQRAQRAARRGAAGETT
jgi:hypothetical protein